MGPKNRPNNRKHEKKLKNISKSTKGVEFALYNGANEIRKAVKKRVTVNERRNKILEKLCVRRHDTRENLAVEFGVSKRTIERDILVLSLEYPLNTARGNGGGIYVEDWYRTNGKYLTDEQSALLEKLANGLSGNELAVMQDILKTFKLNKHNREGKK